MFEYLEDLEKKIYYNGLVALDLFNLLPTAVNERMNMGTLPKNYNFFKRIVKGLEDGLIKNAAVMGNFEESLAYIFETKDYFDLGKMKRWVSKFEENDVSLLYKIPYVPEKRLSELESYLSPYGIEGPRLAFVAGIVSCGLAFLVSDSGQFRTVGERIRELQMKTGSNPKSKFRIVHPEDYCEENGI